MNQAQDYSPEDIEELESKSSLFHDALFENPLDEMTIIDVLCSTTNEERQLIRGFYKKSYGHPIQNDINTQIKDRLRQISIDMFDTPYEYDARELHAALSSFTNDSSVIVEIFSSRPSAYLEIVDKAYNNFYKISLKDEVKKQCGGEFAEYLIALMEVERPTEQTISGSDAYECAEDLKNGGLTTAGTDVEKFKNVFIEKSREDLILISRAYYERSKKNLYDAIENEVPEISEGIVSVYKVVREAGYRSKIAVYSNKLDVDPVGACVGPKGVRIQAVIRELEGEKIDILKYDEDPHVFIKNALSPAEVTQVVIRDAEKKEALAIVPESSFSLAIGKQGQNVRLANRLCDWLIDVKTEEQAAELDLTESDTRKAAESLFNDAADDSYEEVSTVSQLPGVDQKIAALLKDAGIDDIEKFMAAVEDGSAIKVQGVNADDIEAINKIISENVEFEDEEEKTEDAVVESSEETQEEEGYFCPECGERITLDMTHCPKCGAEFVFEEE